MNQPFELENLPAELQSRIEERCDDFEQSWQNGENPSLEQTLFDFTNPTRSVLLKELILIERYYRLRETGKIISEQELLAAHPEIAGELSEIFAASHSARTRIADQSDSGSADSSGSLTAQESRLHFEQFPVRFGRYQILSRLGEGGMGCVYLARDTQLERKVALKLPQINSHADTQFISRFYREARAAANLNHPNLCSVYDVDQIDDVHYITMEFIEGESLAALIQSGQKYSQNEIAQLIQQLAQALELAHQQGIVHRDLKPANIMIRQDGTPIITDFGLATMSQNEEATQITQHGQIMGSPSYMSPEQVEGDLEKIGPASDIYSLGVIMYELLAGQRPFQGATASILSQIMTKDPRPVRNIQPDIDSRLDQICRKMMARSTEQRYNTMQEVSQVLSTWQKTNLSATSQKRLSPGRILVGMTLAAVLLLGITFLRPSNSKGTLHVTLNDQRAQILLDGKPLDLKSGIWTGTQKSGLHELSLQIGDQRLPWGELTTVKSDGNEQRVLASVNGVPLKNGRFEIVPNTTESAEIKLSWLPVEQKTDNQKTEVGTSVKQQPVVSKPVEPEKKLNFDEQIAFERAVAEWVIGLGGKIHYRLANGGKSTDSIDSLPDEPFLVSEIHFENAAKKKLTLPDMSRLNLLLALQSLDVSECTLEPGALAQLRFGNMLTTLNVDHSSLKSSELKTIQGLEFLDTFDISNSQIDDDFLFLQQMPDLRAIWISKASLELLQKLAGSPFLSHSKLRFLRIEFDDEIDDSLIEQLQSACPGMTIIAANLIDHRKYLGTPYARLAADRLLDQGCSIRANEYEHGVVNFTKDLRPSKTVPFRTIGIKLPPELALTPQIVADLTQLPAYFGLVGDRVKNADLLADVPVLKRCAGIHLMDSDLTDQGFEALAHTSPYCYFHIKGTQVSPEMQQRIDREFPLIAFHGNSRNGLFWLNDKVPFPEPDLAPSTAKLTDEEQIVFERETAEWVINLGGKVSFKKAHGTEYLKNRLDQLPEEPFRLIEIDFSKPNQKITFPSLSRLSRLVTLHSLNIMNCNLEPGALEGLHFNENATEFLIYNTPLKTSDLTSNMGLEHLDTFKLGAVQIDDHFRFLELMPRLRNLHLYSPVPQVLESLARSPGFAKLNLRFLNIASYGRKFEPELIAELQKIQPGMTVIDTDGGSMNRYLGIPVARQAAIKLLDLGGTINAKKGKTFDKSEYPPESELFVPGRVILPSDLEVTPEVVEALSRLPEFFGLEASGVRNADLLAGIPVLRLCGGIQVPATDLSDQGFESFFQAHPDGYVNAAGTKISREKAEKLNRDYPYAAFHTDYLPGRRWLDVLSTSNHSNLEIMDTDLSDREREIAGWVIEQGGYLKCTQQNTPPNFSQKLPEGPFRVLMIDFRSSTKKPLTLSNLDRMNQLKGLQFLKLSECLIDSADFGNVRLGPYLQTLIINDSSLNTSDFRTVEDQESLDAFELSGSQIDDDFQFLEQMSNLRRLRLRNPAIQTLEKLANSPHLARSQLRFLELEFDGEMESKLIQQLQKSGPRLTILGIDLKKQSRYLGTPYAKQAADRLLDLGCTFNGSQTTKGPQIFSKDQHPSESFPFQVGGFSFPSGLEITPEIVNDLSGLPGPFVGLVANGVKNADLLAEVRILKRCSAIRLENSDVTDAGFEAFVRRNPDCDFHVAGTQITKEKLDQIDQDFPLVTFFSKFGGSPHSMDKLK